ncbi:MAG: DUF362 domain-containing protein [Syntrophorhabdales bacterium]
MSVALTPIPLSMRFLASFYKYYDAVEGVSRAYLDGQWRRWAEEPGIKKYAAGKEGKVVARIVYDPRSSLIEEILADDPGQTETLLPQVVDALIGKESLLAAEILEADAKKLYWMVEYGFRPTRSYSAHGLSFLRMDLSTAVYMERAGHGAPVRPYRRKERVAIERIPAGQTQVEIEASLRRLTDNLGGIGRFVKRGSRVVIKPNIVADHGMKDGVYTGGVVTDIRLVSALIDLLLPVAGEVVVAEGSSINRSETGRMFAHYGYDRLAEADRRRVRLVDLNTDALVEKNVPSGKRMSSRKVPVTIDEADLVISVPVLKIHFAAGVSLAVKNLQGVMPPLEKYMSHFFGLWQNLVNIHHLVKPGLTIIDGITGQEDFGPVSGRPKAMNVLIGGTNPVAVDAVAMRVMGLDPPSSPPVLLAYLQGLGPIEEDLIDTVGASVDEVASPFKQPLIDLGGGADLSIHDGRACPGCRGYLHFVLNKLRRPDPAQPGRLLIDRPFEPKVNIFIGPATPVPINREETNIFMGMCQQHHAAAGVHLPGCPPHAEVIMNGIFRLLPDVARPKYADETEEAKLERMLKEVLALERR